MDVQTSHHRQRLLCVIMARTAAQISASWPEKAACAKRREKTCQMYFYHRGLCRFFGTSVRLREYDKRVYADHPASLLSGPKMIRRHADFKCSNSTRSYKPPLLPCRNRLIMARCTAADSSWAQAPCCSLQIHFSRILPVFVPKLEMECNVTPFRQRNRTRGQWQVHLRFESACAALNRECHLDNTYETECNERNNGC